MRASFSELPFTVIATELDTSIKQRLDYKKEGYVYVVECAGVFKIGCSICPDTRLKGLQLPYPAVYIFKIHTDDMYRLENRLQKMFEDKHVNGEWFKLTEEDLKKIRRAIASLPNKGAEQRRLKTRKVTNKTRVISPSPTRKRGW